MSPCLAWIVPKLDMPAFEDPLKRRSPFFRKSESWMSKVDAIKLPTLIWAPLPIKMPLGLMRKTFPLDSSFPRRLLCICPTTRLRTADEGLDWIKRVSSPDLMEKSFQWIIVWSSVLSSRTFAWVELDLWALPEMTLNPSGLAKRDVVEERMRAGIKRANIFLLFVCFLLMLTSTVVNPTFSSDITL